VYANTSGVVVAGNGTSYSNPNIAGLIACFWEAFPEMSNMQLLDAVQKSSSRYTNPDMRYGYGIPDFRKAFYTTLREKATLTTGLDNCTAIVLWESRDNPTMQYKVQRKLPTDADFVTIFTTNGKSTGFQKTSYHYNDFLPNFTGNVQYRVQQVIGTDSTLQIGAGSVNFVNACASEKGVFVSVSPNPVSNNIIQLKISTSEALPNLSFSLTAINGRVIKQMKFSAPLGVSTQLVSLNHVQGGVYVVKVHKGNEEIYTGKIVVK
jgi:serine protease AprX